MTTNRKQPPRRPKAAKQHTPSGGTGQTGPRRLGTAGGRNNPRSVRKARRRFSTQVVALIAFLVVAAVIGTILGTSGGTSSALAVVSGPAGPEGVPLEAGQVLAPATNVGGGATVDGVQCNSAEQVVYHVHTHLAVFVNGVLRPLPAGIGIVQPVASQTPEGPFDAASNCYYWLHVHAQDGVIHIESPSQRSYTLGQFFDIWGQPLGTHEVGPVQGTLHVFVNGRAYKGDPRAIQLGSHEDVQIDVGSPVVAPQRVDWAATQL
ncbi:MAG: hypothetical protein JWM85_1251 [Acidimicrobiaceae bacterium]|nr:hypothetical protein [Acidimicrobiaceae bacterium]